jgi:endoglucanase
LLQAGVTRADGFFLNVSNFRADPQLEKYGTWIAKCIWFADSNTTSWGAGHAEWCGSQYYPATFEDFSSWSLTDQWYIDNVESQTWVPVPYPGVAGLQHFVIDTSRNGVGPWQATPEQLALGDVQEWCNPPARGLGKQPTTKTKIDLLDAYLWIKIPGHSDGQCNRWAPAGSPDPVREMADPAAGVWFPEMALELTANANPPIH